MTFVLNAFFVTPQFPKVQGTPTTTGGTSTTIVINMPGTVNAGELLLAIVERRSSAGVNQTLSPPSGWTQVTNFNGKWSTANLRGFLIMAWKIADGTEGGGTATFTSTLSTSQNFSGWVARITHFDTTNPVIAESTADISTSATPNPPNFAPGVGIKNYLWGAYMCMSSTTNTFNSYPTNYGLYQQQWDGVASSAAGLRNEIAFRELAAASEDPGTFSINSFEHIAKTFAVVPEAL